MKAKDHMRFRLELLEAGEMLGWPRIPVGQMPALRAGQAAWERYARGPSARVIAALRYAKIRRDNLGGEKDTVLARVVTFDMAIHERPPEPPKPDWRAAALAKGRAVRAAKLAAKKEAASAATPVL